LATKLCLIVGHKESSQGAKNVSSGLTEYNFNDKLAHDIKEASELDITIVYRDTYKSLPDKINKLNPDFCVSLHCNAFNRKARGTELLYYHTSQKSLVLADELQERVVGALMSLDRGIKPKRSEDRGGYLLRYVDSPIVIAESFFIDNDQELENVNDRYADLVDAYVTGLNNYSN